jgi:anti-sigma factor RsiW
MNYSDTDIHSLIDGELAADEAARVQAWVDAAPERRAAAAAYLAQRQALRALFDPVLAEPIPDRLVAAAQLRRSANDSSFRRYASMAAVALVCLGAGWFSHAWYARPGTLDTMAYLPRRAAVAHAVYAPEVRHPVEVGADQEAHLVQWLSKRLAVPVRAPTLARHGFRLVGGRLLPGDDRPVAQFMYQNDAGRRLTLYVVALAGNNGKPAAESAFRFERVNNVSVFSWSEDGSGYALSGDITREELMPIARLVYEDLNAPPLKGG